MNPIEEHIKTIALRIQEAVRQLAPVLFDDAVPVALALVEKHGVNKVWTVDQIKVAGALELKSLVDQTLNPQPAAPKDPSTKTPATDTPTGKTGEAPTTTADTILATKKELDKPADNTGKPAADAPKATPNGATTETEGNEGQTEGGGDPNQSPAGK